jgi:ATP-dependent Clp protease ATP-binding subunit ClpB
MKALNSFLRPEFINRVDEIITFNSLTVNDFESIAVIMLEELVTALEEKSIKFSYSAEAVRYIAENSFSQKYGARNMRRFIRTNVEDQLAESIIADYTRSISIAKLKFSKKQNKLIVECI